MDQTGKKKRPKFYRLRRSLWRENPIKAAKKNRKIFQKDRCDKKGEKT